MKRKLFSGSLAVAVALIAMLNISIVSDSSKRSIVKLTTLAAAAAEDSGSGSGSGSGSESGSGSGSESGSGSGSGGILDDEHPKTVSCAASTFKRIDYYNSSNQVVGYYLMKNGVVYATYSGSYSYSIETSGGVAAHDATMIECYGWGWGCTPKTAAQACS